MLIVISPAKTLDFENARIQKPFSLPQFISEANDLIHTLRKYSPMELMGLMHISDKLAALNHERYLAWNLNHESEVSRQAVFAFKGEVYTGLKAHTFTDEDCQFAQQHLAILSGLYGLLQPLDRILPYRLEMGIKLPNKKGSNLYDFWKAKVTASVNLRIPENEPKCLINLASAEYFKVLDVKKLKIPVITPVFKDYTHGEYIIVAIYAKKARGLMTNFIIKNRITNPEQIKTFAVEGYSFNDRLSDETNWVFTRG